MSNKMNAQVTCKCGHMYDVVVYGSIWGEYPENREMVMQDKINVFTCPKCNFKFKSETSIMYTNSPMNFAVWWEPVYSPDIDKSIEMIKAMGGTGYLTEAPRIRDWEEFKQTIIKYETGEIKATSLEETEAFKNFMKKI